MNKCLQEENSKQWEHQTEAKLLSGLVNCRLKFWYIEEIGNTLTTFSIVSSAVCGAKYLGKPV